MAGYAFAHEGRAFTPDGADNAHITDVSSYNKTIECAELAWLQTGPDKVFLYVAGGNDKPWSITTWLGTVVSSYVRMGRRANVGFGYHSYRRSVDCRIFGRRYVGWYYESSGSYCRLRLSKRQDINPLAER